MRLRTHEGQPAEPFGIEVPIDDAEYPFRGTAGEVYMKARRKYIVGAGEGDPRAFEVEARNVADAEQQYVSRYGLLARPDDLKAVPAAKAKIGDGLAAFDATEPAPPDAEPEE